MNFEEKDILVVDNIEKYYGSYDNIVKVLNGVSLTVEQGEFVGIMGPSGSGKTTLLNCISTIDTASTGKIIINGKDTKKLRYNKLNKFRQEELGFVFQEFNLLDTLTAYENIALALSIKGEKFGEIDVKVLEISKYLEIMGILNKYPYQLSGGEKQRVAFARAIVTNPSLILADEPTGSLDSKSSRLLLEKMDKMNTELKSTILMVTHDAFAASFANRILFLKDGTIFNELIRGDDSRKIFFNRIIDVVSLLGGDEDVF